MVKRFCPVRTPNRSPILQSSFVLQKSPKSNSIFDLTVPEGERRWGQWGGLKVSHFDFAQQEGQLDITLELIDGVDEFFGRVKPMIIFLARKIQNNWRVRSLRW
ncbi:hypothetical protein HED51_22380 [Ochrobactrum grignonense]|nr:hypothetical protein [Brucella grignonensis]